MAVFIGVASVLVGVLAGIFAGYALGKLVRGRSARYWGLNAGALVVCMTLDFVGLVTGRAWLALGAIGLMAGLLTGLKYGYAESIGAWRFVDRWTGTDRELRPHDEPRRRQ